MKVEAKISIPDGATVKSVKLYYKGEEGAFTNVTATVNGDTATATFKVNAAFGASASYKFAVRLEGDSRSHWSALTTTTITQ